MIGTNEIKFEVIKNGNLKLSNVTKQQIENKNKSFLLEMFKILGITVIAAAAAALGQLWASSGLIALGVSEVTIQVGSAAVGAAIDFGVMQGYDAITNNISKTNTFLNALPFLSIISKYKSANKIKNLLNLVEDNQLLKSFNYSVSEINNLNKVLKIFQNKPIKIGKEVFDLSKNAVTKYDVLKIIGSLTKERFVKESLMIFKNKNLSITDLDYLFDLQKILNSISPNLLPRVEQKYFSQAKSLFSKMNFNVNDLLDESKFNKMIFNTRTLKGNKSANLIWAISSMRYTKIIENKLSKKILNTWSKINEFISKINPLAYLNKLINKILSKIAKPIKEKIINPIIKPIKNRYAKLVEKINLKNLSKKTLIKSEKHLESNLIVINSLWLLGYKFQKNIGDSFYVAIYFQDTNQEPRFFNMTSFEFKNWVDACYSSLAGEYYKSNLELGYHLKFSELGYILNFLPIAFLGFLKLSIDTYNQYKRLRGYVKNIKNISSQENVNKVKNMASTSLKQMLASLFFSTALTKSFALSILNKQNQLRLLKSKSKQYANKYLNNKVKKIGRV